MTSIYGAGSAQTSGGAITYSETGSNAAGNSYGGTVMQIAQTAKDVAQIVSSDAQEEDKIQGVRDRIGLAVADAYTWGLASVFYGWASEQWGGTMAKIKDFDSKYNPMTLLLNKLFDSDAWKTEGSRIKKLVDAGITIPEELLGSTRLTRGRSKEELVDKSVAPDFVGRTEDGRWVNNVFALERNEKNLRAEDIWGAAAFFEKFGNDWLGKFSEEKRHRIATHALGLGLVREHHGTIDITWTPELEALAAN